MTPRIKIAWSCEGILKVGDRLFFTCWALILDHLLPPPPHFAWFYDMVQPTLCQKQLGLSECGIFSSRIMQHISPMWCAELRFGNAGTSFLFPRPLSMWLHCFPGWRNHFRNATLCLHMPSTRL
jgi:hypothetical protein